MIQFYKFVCSLSSTCPFRAPFSAYHEKAKSQNGMYSSSRSNRIISTVQINFVRVSLSNLHLASPIYIYTCTWCNLFEQYYVPRHLAVVSGKWSEIGLIISTEQSTLLYMCANSVFAYTRAPFCVCLCTPPVRRTIYFKLCRLDKKKRSEKRMYQAHIISDHFTSFITVYGRLFAVVIIVDSGYTASNCLVKKILKSWFRLRVLFLYHILDFKIVEMW